MKYSKELKAGLIVLVTLLTFWWLFQFLKGRDVFSSGNMYYATYANVDGLETTKPVTINGLRVGKVEEIEPLGGKNGDYKFRVKFSVDEDFRFNRDSKAEIYEPGIMAGKQMRILLSDAPPLAEPNDELVGVINPSITDVLSQEVTPLKDNITGVLQSLDSTLTITQKVLKQTEQGNLKLTIDNANKTMSSFRRTSDSAGDLLVKNSETLNALLKDANKIMSNIDKTLNKYGQVADKVNGLEVEKSLAQLQESIAKLNTFMDTLNSQDGTFYKVMTDDELYNNLNQTMENLNSLIKDLEANPKKYVNISVFGKK